MPISYRSPRFYTVWAVINLDCADVRIGNVMHSV